MITSVARIVLAGLVALVGVVLFFWNALLGDMGAGVACMAGCAYLGAFISPPAEQVHGLILFLRAKD